MFSLALHDDPTAALASVTSLLGDGVWSDGLGGLSGMAGAAAPPCLRVQKPALFLLSSLFRATYLSTREHVVQLPLATVSHSKKFLYSGETLDQFDLDVLLYVAQQPRAATGCMVAPAVLLREMHLRHDERNRQRLFESLARLHGCCLEVRKGSYRYMTRLLNRLLLDGSAASCLVEVNDEVLKTVGRGPQQVSRRQDRYALGRHGLDKWLHGAMGIFAAGFEADLGRLQALTGLEHKSPKAFREMLRRSLGRLATAGCIAGSHLLLTLPGEDLQRVVLCGAQEQHPTCGFLQQTS